MSAAEKKDAKKKCSTAKAKFTRSLNGLNTAQQANNSIHVLKDLYAELKIAYTELENKNDCYIELLDEDNEDDKKNAEEATTYFEEQYTKYLAAKTIMIDKLAETADQKEPVDQKPKNNDSNVRVKKLDAPSFSGNIRNYPSFKREFQSHMVPSFGENCCFALKSCLSDELKKEVEAVDDDYTEMWKKLDFKYGRPERVVEAVLSDIKKLQRVSSGDTGGFLHMVDVIENAWLELKRLNMTEEIDNTTMMGQMEMLIPPIQQREWALRKVTESETHSFSEFLDFLLDEKKAMEYLHHELRNSERESDASINLTTGTSCAQADPRVDALENTLSKMVTELANITERLNERPSTRGPRLGIQKRCWYHASNSHDIPDCNQFLRLDDQAKLDAIRQRGVCIMCLKPGHIARNCTDKKICTEVVNGQVCGKNHHPLLHQAHINGIAMATTVHVHGILNERSDKTATILAFNNVECNGQPSVTFWDGGSNVSLITHTAAKQRNLPYVVVTLSITTVGNITKNIQSKEYTANLKDMEGKIWQVRLYGIEKITANTHQVNFQQAAKLFDVDEESIFVPTGNVDILIGSDCCSLLPDKFKSVGNLQLMKGPFGYCIQGSHDCLKIKGALTKPCKVTIDCVFGQVSHAEVQVHEDASLKSCMDKFLETDSLGTNCRPKCGNCSCGKCAIGSRDMTIKDEQELKQIEDGLQYDKLKQEWTVTYPWKTNPNTLRNNFKLVAARLTSTEKKLKRQGSCDQYNQEIASLINRGAARKLSNNEMKQYKGPVHYIPHHDVWKPESKSTPLRIVFEANVRHMGKMLNDYWCKGPDVMNNLLGILLRFREGKIAFTGDISKMYNSIKLSPIDQHVHRFLWRNCDPDQPPDHYILQVVPFGDKPSGCIAITSMMKTAEMHKDEHPATEKMLKSDSYVDDIVHSTDPNLEQVDSMEEAKYLMTSAEKVLKTGNFVIKHWTMSGDTHPIGLDIKNDSGKVLGMLWDPCIDCLKYKVKLEFSFKKHNLSTDNTSLSCIPQILTKRLCLSQLSKVYDPYGLVNPFILKGKLLMRELCMTTSSLTQGKLGWDDPIPDDLKSKWEKFFTDIFDLENISFKRCIKPNTATGNPNLVIYSDGSSLAYGACAYIQWKCTDGTYKAQLCMSKNRVAPIKQLTIPRLELNGAVIASRIRAFIITMMRISFERCLHLTDSQIVRSQIQKESHGFATFVAHRIAEIQETTSPDEWWWIETKDNPADMTTRCKSPSDLDSHSEWQEGPHYLTKPIEEWPIHKTCVESVTLPDRMSIKLTHATNASLSMINELITKYSSWYKLSIAVAWLRRFVTFMKNKENVSTGHITVTEIKDSKVRILAFVQKQIYSKELLDLKATSHKVNRESSLAKLCPFVGPDGLLRVGGRLQYSTYDYNRIHQVILPKDHHLTEIIIHHYHKIDGHAPPAQVLASTRERFWIVHGTSAIKNTLKPCIPCKRQDAVLGEQIMSPLPACRTASERPPFSSTGIDFFGPIQVKCRRSRVKRYGCIFTCMTMRAVHIEIAHSMDTCSFIDAFRRFACRRGDPKEVYSDNGSNLVAGEKELKQAIQEWNQTAIMDNLRQKETGWHFNPPTASHMGGSWERLIRSVKRELSILLREQVPSDETLLTVMAEVERILNDRPLTALSDHHDDLLPLTPNDLLLLRNNTSTPPGIFTENDLYTRKRWKQAQHLANVFWKRWIREYLPTLQIRQKWLTPKDNIKVGELVLLKDDDKPRGHWPLARVLQTDLSSDGKVRSAKLKTTSGDLHRPITMICRLEYK